MMQLYYAPTSPFVRKVTALALERGLDKDIERLLGNPWDPASAVSRDNPLGKVPALRLHDGTLLVDSTVICEYLDAQAPGQRLFPDEGAARWRALNLQALGDGLMEAAVAWTIERMRRPEPFRWSGWIDRQRGKVEAALDDLEANVAVLAGRFTIGALTVACALGYLDFRFADLPWRDKHPRLAAWYSDIAKRPSLQATEPKEST